MAEMYRFLSTQRKTPVYDSETMKHILSVCITHISDAPQEMPRGFIQLVEEAVWALDKKITGVKDKYDSAVSRIQSKVEIRATESMGDGVFVMEDVKKGDVLTAYPMDTARMHGNWVCFNQQQLPNDAYTLEVYALAPISSINGDQSSVRDPKSIGHMVNDGVPASVNAPFLKELKRPLTADDVAKCKAWYDACSLRRNNADYLWRDGCVVVEAMKNIKRGEQVFAPYGAVYWVQRHQPDIANDYNRFNDGARDTPCYRETIARLASTDMVASYARFVHMRSHDMYVRDQTVHGEFDHVRDTMPALVQAASLHHHVDKMNSQFFQ